MFLVLSTDGQVQAVGQDLNTLVDQYRKAGRHVRIGPPAPDGDLAIVAAPDNSHQVGDIWRALR